jgi:site-specific DNA-methyltransferase (adenine-specific)
MTGLMIEGDSLEGIEDCDHLMTDPPYSEETHAGSIVTVEGRRNLNYPFWSPEDVARAVKVWAPSVAGWFVILTDHVLAPIWRAELRVVGLYAFAPLPAVITGASVRMQGDGPSSWARWIVVARPKCEPFSRWGTLPGAYVGSAERMPWVGGKPLWLMRALVRDYSKVNDTICDPCCGAGTTLVAARDLGRNWIGYDVDAKAIEATEKRMCQQVLDLGGA